jgi:hypothetical protein
MTGTAAAAHASNALGAATSPRLERRRFDGLLRTLLVSGGDDRIWPDPETLRNRYGTPVAPAADEVWFSSCTATGISAPAFDAAHGALSMLLDGEHATRQPMDAWFHDLRTQIVALYGCAGSTAVLTPSGTEGELIALAVAKCLFTRPLTNIVIAAAETGSGVPKAAAGMSFLASTSLGGATHANRRLDGWAHADIEVANVEIRSPGGDPRPSADIDRDAAMAAGRALARGRSVLLHILDASKTGLTGVSRDAALQIAAVAPDRVMVVVDACQLRSPPEQLCCDLECGFMVLITGSKFAGGPPFCGALLLPEAVAHRLRRAPSPPEGLADYSARLDWPHALQDTFAREFTFANLGAGLRWTAALAELQRLKGVPQELQSTILSHFRAEVIARARSSPFATTLHDAGDGDRGTPSIVPILACHDMGAPFTAAEAAVLHLNLRKPLPACGSGPRQDGLDRVIHVGQPVTVGSRSALRICASARHVADVAMGIAQGAPLVDAFAPIACNLDLLFAKWAAIADGVAT